MLFTGLPELIVLGLSIFGGIMLGLGLHPGGAKWRRLYDELSDDFSDYRRDADIKLREANARITELERDAEAVAVREEATRDQISALTAQIEGAKSATAAAAPAVSAGSTTPMASAAPVIAAGLGGTAIAATAAEVAPASAADASPEEDVAAVEPADAPSDGEPAASGEQAAAETQELMEPAIAMPSWFKPNGSGDNFSLMRGVDDALHGRLNAMGITNFADIAQLSAEDEAALEQRLELPAGYIAQEQWRDQVALLIAGNHAEHTSRYGG